MTTSNSPALTDHQALVLATLDALFELAHRPTDASGLALRLGTTPTAIARALLHLEERGLADASAIRLTLRGLAAASALRAHAQPAILAA